MKKAGLTLFGVLFLCYIAATIVKSDFWGNLFSPFIMLAFCLETFVSYCVKDKNKISRIIGLLFSLGLLAWGIADILWAIYDMLLHVDPQDDMVIAFCYMLTNLFFAAALITYAYGVFRKWNIVQFVIDAIVMSFFVIELIWTIFLHESTDNIIILRSDWISTMSIILDVMIAVGIVIWYMSVRSGRMMMHIRFMGTGALIFVCTDLAYYYHYLYGTYEANTILDAVYVISFGFIALAAMIRRKAGQTLTYDKLHNTGQKGKGYALLLAPILLVMFRGFDVTRLLQFVSVILLYHMVSNYIQNSIYKEGLLFKEREYTNELEQKVKKRTEELEEKNNVLTHLLDQDFITGLKNRRFLLTYLEREMATLKEGDTIVVLYIDINRFKMILTMYGHYIGDMILYEMAEKLKPLEKMTGNNVLTSYRDDNFVYVAVGRYDYKQGYELAQKAIELCSHMYKIDEYQIRVTVNIGISVFPKDASTKEELMKHADIAMHQGRSRGFDQVQEFDAELSKTAFRRNTIEILLKKVNYNQEFMVYYQPQFRTDDKKLIGFEALLRWKTPSGEMIGPGEFIPVAEETGCIIPIGDWVTTMALKQLVLWNRRCKDKIMIGINVSLKQMNTLKFMKSLKDEIVRLELNPRWIDLEITESLPFQENPEILAMLEDIQRFGVHISIDDFGTGYSSLSYFKNLPIDRIKLAKELVDNIHIDEFDYKLAEAIILLSKAKGIRVIAEGVETIEQWEALKKLGCDEVQGFYFGKPEPVSVIETTYRKELVS